MPCPHFRLTIVKRSRRQSVVAGAAYQSGSKLFSEYEQKTKDYHNKKEVAYSEILLPPHAPRKFFDRGTLWNSVEAAETQWNAQLARRIVLALPVEVPEDQYPQMLREYCQQNFADRGMCVDFAIHNKHDGNPHAHILLTMRSLDAFGRWMEKSRKEYLQDENGERMRYPGGEWRCRKVYVNDWNDPANCEAWRHAWECKQNEYLERNNRPERVSLKSYARQGVEQIPTVHMGPAVAHMEAKGIETNIGNLNRDIRATNRLLQSIRSVMRGLKEWLSALHQRKQALLDAIEKLKQPTLPELLAEYYQLRSAERSGWSSRAKLKGTAKDYEKLTRAIAYLRSHDLITLDALHEHVGALDGRYAELSKQVKAAQRRMADIAAIRKALKTYTELKPIHTAYMKKNFQKSKERYQEAHREELDSFNKALRLLKKVNGGTEVDLGALRSEYAKLEAETAQNTARLETVKAELQELKSIRYYVSRVVPEEPAPEQVSIEDRMSEGRLRADRDAQNQQVQTQQRQQNTGRE